MGRLFQHYVGAETYAATNLQRGWLVVTDYSGVGTLELSIRVIEDLVLVLCFEKLLVRMVARAAGRN